MSYPKRDNANELSSPDTTQPRTSTLPTRSDRPLFVGRRNGTSNGSFGRPAKDGEKAGAISRPRSGGWMSGKGPRMGLGEAFSRTDMNGNFLPPQRPSARREAVPISDSRIPRTRSFSPMEIRSSPPQIFDDGYKLAGRQGRAASIPLDSESDTGTRDASPSPAARNRRWEKEESGSDASLSLVEDPTMDNFDKKMNQHAEDQERTRRLLSSQKGIFLKGQVGPRVAETTRTLAKKASDSSLEAEPPIRLPRTWGSKARRNDGWMQKILSPDTSLELKDTLENQASLERQCAEADVPLPSVEDISQNPTPPASRPASAQPNNDSPEKSQMWNADIDFTAHSLLMTSSPQLRVRSTALDEIRDREIQLLSARAVATNRLEQIKERNSEDRSLFTPPVEANPKDIPIKENKTPETQPEEAYNEMTILEEEGEQIHGTPVTIFSRVAYENRSCSNSSSREIALNKDGEGSAQRPKHSRDDSRELLRRLSRAASHSPAPEKQNERKEEKSTTTSQEQPVEKKEEKEAKAGAAEAKPEKPLEKGEERTVRTLGESVKSEVVAEKRSESSSRRGVLDVGQKRYSGVSTPPKSDVDPEERITAEARLFDLQDNRSERNSIKAPSRSPSPASEDGLFDETPRPKPRVDPLSLPTPKVTGAYIETPAPTAKNPREARSISPYYEVVSAPSNEGSSSETKQTKEAANEASASSTKDQPRRTLRRTSSHRELITEKKIKPRPLINTAKPASVADDLRRIQQETQLEDTTLDDFDALLEADAATTPDLQNSTTILEPVLDLEYDERGLPLSKKAIERRIERIQLDRMSQSIKNTSSSIRDARQGIERLEEQVSSALPNIEKSNDAIYINLKIPIPKLYISTPPPKPGMKPGWKFTWLGLILAIFLGWYISESAMCAQFCHPENSKYDTWHPSDPFFPWAIPTKLDQWTGKLVSTTVSDIWDVVGWQSSPKRYRGGPLSASDWWLGRDGPVGLKVDDSDWNGSFGDDEIIGM